MYTKTAGVMCILSVYVLKLALFNELEYYIHTRYITVTVLAALVTCAVAVFGFMYRRHMHEHGEFTRGIGIQYASIVIALCIAILLPAQPLQSFTALQRGDPGAPFGPNVAGLLSKYVDDTSPDLTIREWIILLNRKEAKLADYEGREVDVIGFLYPNTDRQFYVSRFIITCCTADATPIGIPVQYEWNTQFRVGDWVRVVGEISIVNGETKPKALIIPTSVKNVPQPTSPYIH